MNILNFRYFCSSLEKIKEATFQFCEGMDKIDHNILLLDVGYNNEIEINTVSKLFLKNFSKFNSTDKNSIQQILQNFIEIQKLNLSNNKQLNKDNIASTLYDYLILLINEDFSNENSRIFRSSQKNDNYLFTESLICSTTTITGAKEYYKIKMVKYSPYLISHNQNKILIIFKLIKNYSENYESKINIQMLSSYIFEIKNVLSVIEDYLKYVIEETKTHLVDNKNINDFNSKECTKKDANSTFINISYTLYYLILKVNHYVENIDINILKIINYSKIRLYLPYYNLDYLLTMSFECFEYSNHKINLSNDFKNILIKIDLEHFKFLTKSIFFYLETYTSIQNINIIVKKQINKYLELDFIATKCNNISHKSAIQEDLFSVIEMLVDLANFELNQTVDYTAQTIRLNIKIEEVERDKSIGNKNFNCYLFEDVNQSQLYETNKIEHNNKNLSFVDYSLLESNSFNNAQQISNELQIQNNNSNCNQGSDITLDLKKQSLFSLNRASNISLNKFNLVCKCFNILIVDDDSMCINYVENVVKTLTTKIQVATDGLKAFEKVQELIKIKAACISCQTSDTLIIFMDIHMPIMDGLESAKLINSLIFSTNNKIDCKIFFISGNVDSQYIDIINSIQNCIGQSNKPIKKSNLISLLGKYL